MQFRNLSFLCLNMTGLAAIRSIKTNLVWTSGPRRAGDGDCGNALRLFLHSLTRTYKTGYCVSFGTVMFSLWTSYGYDYSYSSGHSAQPRNICTDRERIWYLDIQDFFFKIKSL